MKIRNYSAGNIATPVHQVVQVRRHIQIQKNLKNPMHLHKAIVSRAKAQITALKQSTGIRTTLVANGMKILIYTASGDQADPEKNLNGLQPLVKATVMVVKNIRKKGK